MTALSRALELPDEPKRQWRGVPAALIGAAVCLVAGVVVARTLALGGWLRPWLAVEAVLAVPSMLATWVLVGPHRMRTGITAAVMVVALALQPLAASGATPSPARLARMIDHLELPGESVRDVHVGNGRCDPVCSELRRTSVARGSSFAKVTSQVVGILRYRGFEVRQYGRRRATDPLRVDAAGAKLRVQIELRMIDLNETRIAQVWIAEGPKSDFEVG